MAWRGRVGRRTAAAVLAATAAISLSACGQSDGRALAAQACHKVDLSLRLVRQADSAPPAQAEALRYRAVLDLQAAEPIAALAAGEDTEWQALQATLQEAGQIPEQHLVGALTAQCASPAGDG